MLLRIMNLMPAKVDNVAFSLHLVLSLCENSTRSLAGFHFLCLLPALGSVSTHSCSWMDFNIVGGDAQFKVKHLITLKHTL